MTLRPTSDTSVEGVIILSPAIRVLHISPRALQLIHLVDIKPTLPPSEFTLPMELQTIGQDVHNRLQASLEQGKGLTCDIEQAISSPTGSLFVRGLGVPNHEGGDFFTVLVVSDAPVVIRSME